MLKYNIRAVPALLVAACALLIGAERDSFAQARSETAPDTIITIRTTSAALSFEPEAISVKAGKTVRIRYVNASGLAHNIIILRKEDDIDVVGAASYDAGDTDFVPKEHKNRMIAYSKLASPGKTVEFTFVAPPAGKYPFACFVDGHFNMMIGTLHSRK